MCRCLDVKQRVYRAVIIARLTYATSAWWGFTTLDARQRIEGLLRRGIRAGYYRPDCPTVENLVEDADDAFVCLVLNNQHRLLHSLLADKNGHGYDLRRRRHDRILSHNDDQRDLPLTLLKSL